MHPSSFIFSPRSCLKIFSEKEIHEPLKKQAEKEVGSRAKEKDTPSSRRHNNTIVQLLQIHSKHTNLLVSHPSSQLLFSINTFRK
jgi:hypothetical protein